MLTEKECPRCGGALESDALTGEQQCKYCGFKRESRQVRESRAAEGKNLTLLIKMKRDFKSAKYPDSYAAAASVLESDPYSLEALFYYAVSDLLVNDNGRSLSNFFNEFNAEKVSAELTREILSLLVLHYPLTSKYFIYLVNDLSRFIIDNLKHPHFRDYYLAYRVKFLKYGDLLLEALQADEAEQLLMFDALCGKSITVDGHKINREQHFQNGVTNIREFSIEAVVPVYAKAFNEKKVGAAAHAVFLKFILARLSDSANALMLAAADPGYATFHEFNLLKERYDALKVFNGTAPEKDAALIGKYFYSVADTLNKAYAVIEDNYRCMDNAQRAEAERLEQERRIEAARIAEERRVEAENLRQAELINKRKIAKAKALYSFKRFTTLLALLAVTAGYIWLMVDYYVHSGRADASYKPMVIFFMCYPLLNAVTFLVCYRVFPRGAVMNVLNTLFVSFTYLIAIAYGATQYAPWTLFGLIVLVFCFFFQLIAVNKHRKRWRKPKRK